MCFPPCQPSGILAPAPSSAGSPVPSLWHTNSGRLASNLLSPTSLAGVFAVLGLFSPSQVVIAWAEGFLLLEIDKSTFFVQGKGRMPLWKSSPQVWLHGQRIAECYCSSFHCLLLPPSHSVWTHEHSRGWLRKIGTRFQPPCEVPGVAAGVMLLVLAGSGQIQREKCWFRAWESLATVILRKQAGLLTWIYVLVGFLGFFYPHAAVCVGFQCHLVGCHFISLIDAVPVNTFQAFVCEYIDFFLCTAVSSRNDPFTDICPRFWHLKCI